MTVYLTLGEAVLIAGAAIGAPPAVRDFGLLEAALARPQTMVLGEDAYPSLYEKAAALLQSLVGNHALVDGNKRLGFACTAVFLAVNGAPLTLTENDAYDLVMAVASGELRELSAIAGRLAG
ncbi:death-on-curing protein [Subtercola boreus]|uniref:Death-on-curing protein n=1 Tax=Subtercola boreus TaxID=120213 RepID=A0A3E0W627_9MICO|nr:type II toxin-antitoxin system death-on-curing family toxin [Subtercola boreus]RFA16993.1 death-on-curing protein [Subtercola boreus]